MPDHVHLLVEVASSVPICRLVGVLKGGSFSGDPPGVPPSASSAGSSGTRPPGGGATSGAMRACV